MKLLTSLILLASTCATIVSAVPLTGRGDYALQPTYNPKPVYENPEPAYSPEPAYTTPEPESNNYGSPQPEHYEAHSRRLELSNYESSEYNNPPGYDSPEYEPTQSYEPSYEQPGEADAPKYSEPAPYTPPPYGNGDYDSAGGDNHNAYDSGNGGNGYGGYGGK